MMQELVNVSKRFVCGVASFVAVSIAEFDLGKRLLLAPVGRFGDQPDLEAEFVPIDAVCELSALREELDTLANSMSVFLQSFGQAPFVSVDSELFDAGAVLPVMTSGAGHDGVQVVARDGLHDVSVRMSFAQRDERRRYGRMVARIEPQSVAASGGGFAMGADGVAPWRLTGGGMLSDFAVGEHA